MNRKKIIHILYSGFGGTTDYVFNLIRGDQNNLFEHIILFYGIETVAKPQFEMAKSLTEHVFTIVKAQGYDRSAFKQVHLFIKTQQPHFITLHVNSLIHTCSKFKSIPLFFIEHQANHLKSKQEWVWSVLAQKRAHTVISLTTAYQEELKRKLKFLYRPNKNKIIHTGIDLNAFSTQREFQKSPLKIGMISRINPLRDHATLLAAFQSFSTRKIELHIAGDGPLLQEYKRLNKQKNIFFHGLIPQAKISHFLSELDIYVHASHGETSSLAIMQAQASGLPIIASNVKGISNILNASNAILVQPKSTDEMTKAIDFLLKNIQKRQTLSEISHRFAQKNLSHIRMFEAYKSLMQ